MNMGYFIYKYYTKLHIYDVNYNCWKAVYPRCFSCESARNEGSNSARTAWKTFDLYTNHALWTLIGNTFMHNGYVAVHMRDPLMMLPVNLARTRSYAGGHDLRRLFQFFALFVSTSQMANQPVLCICTTHSYASYAHTIVCGNAPLTAVFRQWISKIAQMALFASFVFALVLQQPVRIRERYLLVWSN